MEALRRLVHASGAGVPLLYVLGVLTWQQLEWVVLGGAVVAGVLEALRLTGYLESVVFDYLTREYERDNPAGYALYVISSAFTINVFAPAAALPGVFMLTLADPVSGLLSSGELRSVKRPRVLLATFGLSTLIAALFVPPLPAVLGGAAATLADGVKPVIRGYVVDDNLTIPPAAALAITVGLAL
ncbi:MAG: dolichol kinase [Haloarculaceae archaeon]